MITYELSFRDNIENFNITGSTVYPYYPPTSTAFSASITNNTYVIQADQKAFTGWRQDYTSYTYTIQGYTITLEQEGRWKQSKAISYTINRPRDYVNPIDSDIDKPQLRDYIYGEDLEPGNELAVLQTALNILNKEDRRTDTQVEDQLLGLTITPEIQKWTPLYATNAKLITQNTQGDSYGFRVQTAGYTDLIVFAEDSAGNRRVPTQEGIIDMGTFTLTRSEADAQKDIDSFQQVDSKTILKNTPQAEKPKGLNNLAQLLTQKSTTLKTILLTAIVPQITQFGISNIKELLEQEGNLDELLSKLPIKCPTQGKIQQLVVLRNKYTTQLNTFFQSISRLSQSLTGSTQVAEALTTGLATVSASRKAANIALGLLPVTPGAAPSAINLLKDLEDTVRPILTKINRTLGILTSTVTFIVGVISTIIQLLNLLDALIFLCAQREGIPYEAINAELTALNNNTISDLQNSSPTQNNTYKGFKFELVIDSSVNFSYPKRYAVAKDKYGVILLKSQSSFTPNPNILIEELKFIIDRDNLSGE